MRQCWNHTWRLLACVLFAIMSVGCGNPNEDPPSLGIKIYSGIGPEYSGSLEIVNCVSFQEPLVFRYVINSFDTITLTDVEVRIRSYNPDSHFDQRIPFPALDSQLPLTIDHDQDFIGFEGVWNQAGYPVPDPTDLFHGVDIDVTAHYRDSAGTPHVVVSHGYVGIEFYTYPIAGGDADMKAPCSAMQ